MSSQQKHQCRTDSGSLLFDVSVLDDGFLLGLGCLLESVLHQTVSLHLLGFVVEQDSQEHHDGAAGGHQRDGVTEHDDAQPDGQSVLHRARHAEHNTNTISTETLRTQYSQWKHLERCYTTSN